MIAGNRRPLAVGVLLVGLALALAFAVPAGAQGTGGSVPGQVPTSTTAPATTRDLPRTALEADQRDDGGGSLAPWVIGSAVAAVVAIAVGGTILGRRSGP